MKDHFYIACKIEGGAFTSERTFTIPLSEDVRWQGETEGKLVGTAHLDHLRTRDKKRLPEDEPPYGSTLDGYVLCRKIRALPDSRLLVEVPSADVIHVSEDAVISVEERGD